MGPIGWPELLIILVVVLLLFGTTRLAGLGKASGKAIREFKEETKDLKTKDAHQADAAAAVGTGADLGQAPIQPPAQPYAQPQAQPYAQQPPAQPYAQQLPPAQPHQAPAEQPYPAQPAPEVYDAEVVDPERPSN